MSVAAESEPSVLLSARQVQSAGRSLPSRFRLDLLVSSEHSEQPLAVEGPLAVHVQEPLRVLPGRRLVARVEVAGRRCLLKLFLGRHARRYRRREVRGCRRMAAAGVCTPTVLGEVADPEGIGFGLLFEYLANAHPVAAEAQDQVEVAAAELARLHAFGCWHGDLHLNNFLVQRDGPGGCVYMIDGDGVRRRRWARADAELPHGASLANLAILCAQRPPLLDAALTSLLAAYSQARSWPMSGPQFDRRLAQLVRATRGQRRVRVRRYLRKVQRACTEFYCEKRWRRHFICLRSRLDDGLRAFAEDPERFMAGAETLKSGNSATVVRTRVGQQTCVVKRYNLKGPWHAMRRALKPDARFRVAWCNGQRLHFLGIPTARPLALLERRIGPLRGVAYLVMEDCGSRDLLAEAAASGLSDRRIEAVARLFQGLCAAGLAHGDTKATNFLILGDDVLVIDLDAMQENPSGQARDIRRFLANWDGQPALAGRFRERFAAAGLPVVD